MLRYKTKLVALYDIRPGNGAGLVLQPGARTGRVYSGGLGVWPAVIQHKNTT